MHFSAEEHSASPLDVTDRFLGVSSGASPHPCRPIPAQKAQEQIIPWILLFSFPKVITWIVSDVWTWLVDCWWSSLANATRYECSVPASHKNRQPHSIKAPGNLEQSI